MTKARDLANIISGGFTADDIPNIPASKITSGQFADARIADLNANKLTGSIADARIPESAVSQHATSFDDNKIVNDISTLALRQASDANRSAYNTNSQSVDVFQDATGIDTTSGVSRNASEYVSSVSETTSAITINSSNYSTYFGTQAQSSTSQGFMITEMSSTGTRSSLPVFNPSNSHTNMSTGSYSDSMATMFTAGGNYGPPNYSISNEASGGNRYHWRFKFKSDYVGFQPTSNYFIWRNGNGGASDFDIIGIDSSNNVTILDNTISGQPSNNAGYTSSSIGGSTFYPEIGYAISWSGSNGYGFDNVTIGGNIKTLSTSATGNFTGTTITAPSSVSSMGAIITYQDNAGTNALNTDIVLQLSADGGSNYSTATLTALPDFSTGIKMAKVNDLSVTAGTQLKYKISFANQASGSKEARIRGVSLQY
jgi:hypothetical protein